MVDESRVRAVWLQEKLSASNRNGYGGYALALGSLSCPGFISG